MVLRFFYQNRPLREPLERAQGAPILFLLIFLIPWSIAFQTQPIPSFFITPFKSYKENKVNNYKFGLFQWRYPHLHIAVKTRQLRSSKFGSKLFFSWTHDYKTSEPTLHELIQCPFLTPLHLNTQACAQKQIFDDRWHDTSENDNTCTHIFVKT